MEVRTELVSRIAAHAPSVGEHSTAIAGLILFRRTQATAGLLNACSRLMELLDTPEDIPFLSHLVQREIIYHILKTPQGRGSGLLQRQATSATGRRERSPGSKTIMRSVCTWRS